MDERKVIENLQQHFCVSENIHDNNELYSIIAQLLPHECTHGDVRKDLSKFQTRLDFYFSLFKSQNYRPDRSTHEAFREDMTVLENKHFPPTLRELYAISEFMEQKVILLKVTDDAGTASGFHIRPIVREMATKTPIIILVTFVNGEPYFRSLLGEERNLQKCSVKFINANHEACLDKRFRNSFHELNTSFLLNKMDGFSDFSPEALEFASISSEMEGTNIFVVFSQLLYGTECMEDYVKDCVMSHMKSDEFYETYENFECIDKFKEEKKYIDHLPDGKEKDLKFSKLRNKAFDAHLHQWDSFSAGYFFAISSVFNVEIYVEKGQESSMFLPICSSYFEIFTSPIYVKETSSETLSLLVNRKQCSCVRQKPFIPGHFPIYQDNIEDYIMKRIGLEPCCPGMAHKTHTHFSRISDSSIPSHDQVSPYELPLDEHIEKVIEVLGSQNRILDQINGGEGSLEQCLCREIFGDENKKSLFKSRFRWDETMNPEKVLRLIADSTGKPVFVFKCYPKRFSWTLFEPSSTIPNRESVCRYYTTIFFNGKTGYFDRIVAKKGCNCKIPSPHVDVHTEEDLKPDPRIQIADSRRHRPLVTFLSTETSPDLFVDELRNTPTVFSRYSEILIAMSRRDMHDKEMDLMSDYSYSLCRCVSKEIFGTENQFESVMRKVMDEIVNNYKLYGKFMRWENDDSENDKFLKNFTSRKKERWNILKSNSSIEKDQAVFFANRIEDGMEMEDLELYALSTCFQIPIYVMCMDETKGKLTTFWKEFTPLERKRKPKNFKESSRKPSCVKDSKGHSKYFIMVYRSCTGQFHRIVPKCNVCNCLTDVPSIPGAEMYRVDRADENILIKIRSIENRLNVSKLALDSWLRCNMAYELLCKEIIDKLENRRKNVNIASIVGSSVGLAGAALAIGGLVAAPFTAGVSLGLTIAGGVVGTAANVASMGSKISELVLNKSAVTQMERYQMNLLERSRCLEKSVHSLQKELICLLSSDESVHALENNTLATATSAIRALTTIPVIILRVIARVVSIADMLLVPLAAVLDAGILAYSIHNLTKGSRTNETERLRTIRTILKVSRVQMQIWGYGNQHQWEKKIEYDNY